MTGYASTNFDNETITITTSDKPVATYIAKLSDCSVAVQQALKANPSNVKVKFNISPGSAGLTAKNVKLPAEN